MPVSNPQAPDAIVARLRRQAAGKLNRLSYLFNREDREDLEQDAVLHAYIYVKQHVDREGRNLDEIVESGLAATIAERRAIDYLRRNKNGARTALTNQFDAPENGSTLSLAETATRGVHTPAAQDPENLILNQDRFRYLEAKLNPQEKALLKLIAEGYVDSEIGDILGIGTKRAKSRIQDMKRKCRRLLCEEYDAPIR